MKRKVWIINHYATNTYFDKNGRHYCLAKYLKRAGYQVTIFCASTVHNSAENVDTEGKGYTIKESDGIPYIFLKTDTYSGNGKQRIKNMVQFYKRMFSVGKSIIECQGSPDVILASSVHPLALVAGIKIAGKLDIPCICEVRDLWPESLIAYGIVSRNSPIASMLYVLEKWIYKRADKLIFTMEGGAQYVKDRGWEKKVNLDKIEYITNGVDLELFLENQSKYIYADDDLDNQDIFTAVYTGSVRQANGLRILIDVAELLSERDKTIKILVFGEGDCRQDYIKLCQAKGLKSIKFIGFVEKKFVPSILEKASMTLLNGSEDINKVAKYGISPNKLFEYVGAGKPILCNMIENQFGLIEKNGFGISQPMNSAEEYCDAILSIKEAVEKQDKPGIVDYKQFTYEELSKKLGKIIEDME